MRQVRAEAQGAVGLCQVGTAAGPLPGDDLELVLDIGAGARVEFGATGASLAQGRGTEAARVRSRAVVGDFAQLRARPGPLIACRDASVAVEVSLALATNAHVEWHELVVLGRTGEPGGAVTLHWDVTRDRVPVLRQSIDLADPFLRTWRGMTAGHRVLGTVLISGPTVRARTQVFSPTAVAQRVAPDTVLITVLAAGAAEAKAVLESALTGVRPPLGQDGSLDHNGDRVQQDRGDHAEHHDRPDAGVVRDALVAAQQTAQPVEA